MVKITQVLLKIITILESVMKQLEDLINLLKSTTSPFLSDKKHLDKIILQQPKLLTILVLFKNFQEIFKNQDNPLKRLFKFLNYIILMKPPFLYSVIFITILDQFILINKMFKKQLNVLKKLEIFSKTFLIKCIQNLLIFTLVKQDYNLFSQEISLKQENILINQLKVIKNMLQIIQMLISNTQ